MSQRAMAARALKAVEQMRDHQHASKLKTLCMKTPSLLQQSGLAQTVVFLRSREPNLGTGDAYAEHLTRVMDVEGISDAKSLQRRALNEKDLSSYIALTARAERACAWMRRFAQVEMATIEEAETDD